MNSADKNNGFIKALVVQKRKMSIFSFFRRVAFVFFLLFVVLVWTGFAPEGAEEINNSFFSLFITQNILPVEEVITPAVRHVSTSGAPVSSEGIVSIASDPFSVIIPKISVNWKVVNTKYFDIASLDRALLSGPVRYPGSGAFGSVQDMVIFGHSSHLPVVHNQAFRVFSRLNEMVSGDLIYLRGANQEYRYKVVSNVLIKASEAYVDVGSRRNRLVLVSCNNFGAKEDRYVVTAELVESHSLSN